MAASTLAVPSASFSIKTVVRIVALRELPCGAAVNVPSKFLTTSLLMLMDVQRNRLGQVETYWVVLILVRRSAVALSDMVLSRRVLNITALGTERLESATLRRVSAIRVIQLRIELTR